MWSRPSGSRRLAAVAVVVAVVTTLAGHLTGSRLSPVAPAPPALPAGHASGPLPAPGPGRPPVAPPRVAPLRALVRADLLVRSTSALRVDLAARVPGVASVLALAAGPVRLRGASATAVAADPGALRAWTPAPTARSDALWARVAAGDAAMSFDLGDNLHLPLGGTVGLQGPSGPHDVRVGALAGLALPGVDVTVSPRLGSALGLAPRRALLVHTTGQDLGAVRARLRARLGADVQVVLLHAPTVLRDAGAFLTRAQLATAVRTATAQVGRPYAWGATGPDRFDCSGLVGFAFAAAGVVVPRTSEQLWLAGPHVPPQQARAGDLLFWANDPQDPADLDHVALYLGGGQMVSAPHSGQVVHVGPVPAAHFQGVVRLDPAAARSVGGPVWSAG